MLYDSGFTDFFKLLGDPCGNFEAEALDGATAIEISSVEANKGTDPGPVFLITGLL